jgi:hypothetical protein
MKGAYMSRTMLVLPVLALLLIPAARSHAQPQMGDWELTLTGSGNASRNVDAGSFATSLGIGHFVTDDISISLRQQVTYANFNVGTDWLFHTRVAADYHFDLDRWQPFVGAGVGYVYGNAATDSFTIGPEAGLKYYLTNRAFAYGMLEYQWHARSGGEINGFRRGNWLYSIGLGVNW